LHRKIVAFLLVVLVGCTSGNGDDVANGGRSPDGAELVFADPSPPVARLEGVTVEDYVDGFEFAVDMAWDGDDSFFVNEKRGAIRIVVGGKLLSEPCATLPVNSEFLSGLLGIVLDPHYDQNHFLYVYYTNERPYENRITRFVVEGNRCTSPRHIVTGIPASRPHNGGQLVFVGGKLFVATGDATKGKLAQKIESVNGKILRYAADGSIPAGNPFSKPGRPSPVWSYGHRNPFGLAQRPGTNQLFQTENGPNCNDELNAIVKGANYGWPSPCGGAMSGADPRSPLLTWEGPIVPTDLSWYEGKIRKLAGALLMAEFRLGRIHRFVINEEGTKVLEHAVVFDGDDRLIHVSEGPGGWLYILTTSGLKRMIARSQS
jgi:glucose/arabinose dehydrogenase